MLKRLGKTITNNFSLKILAVILAVVLWVVVINIDDPTTSKTYTTNVVAENTDYITSQNKYYEPLDSSNVVSFRVSAARSVHDELSNADFSATADMENIEYDEGSGIYRVPVTITAKRYSNKVSVVSKQLYLEVALEDRGTCQKAITAATKGTVMDGCALGTVQIVGSNLLKVSGPASIVSQIDTAVATINVEGMSTDVTDSVVPVLYDADGNVIDTTKLTLSLSTVNISAQILNTKDVPLEFEAKGEPADGYVLTGVESSLDNVRIKGEAATLNTVSKITIPQEVLDISGLTEDLTTTVDISSYLPSQTALVLNSDAKVEVTREGGAGCQGDLRGASGKLYHSECARRLQCKLHGEHGRGRDQRSGERACGNLCKRYYRNSGRIQPWSGRASPECGDHAGAGALLGNWNSDTAGDNYRPQHRRNGYFG